MHEPHERSSRGAWGGVCGVEAVVRRQGPSPRGVCEAGINAKPVHSSGFAEPGRGTTVSSPARRP